MSSPSAAPGTAASATAAAATRWHTTPVEQVLVELDSGPGGLTGTESARRLAALPVRSGPEEEGFLEELAESFTEPLQLLLIAVAVLSAVFGELRDAVAIAVIVVLVAVTETLTETRSARAIAALGELSAPTSRVIRDGHVEEVAGDRLVCGDVVALEAGGPGLCGPDAHRCPGAGRGGVRVPVTGSQDLSPRPAVAERPAGCRHRFSGARAGTRP